MWIRYKRTSKDLFWKRSSLIMKLWTAMLLRYLNYKREQLKQNPNTNSCTMHCVFKIVFFSLATFSKPRFIHFHYLTSYMDVQRWWLHKWLSMVGFMSRGGIYNITPKSLQKRGWVFLVHTLYKVEIKYNILSVHTFYNYSVWWIWHSSCCFCH